MSTLSRQPVWRRALQRVRRGAQNDPLVVEIPDGPGTMQPVNIDERREALLARAVLRDLDVVATTRLLGRDQELYSAVDRHQAEVEFRLAVIPPLLVLVISLGARSQSVAPRVTGPARGPPRLGPIRGRRAVRTSGQRDPARLHR
jgi:hypothetical protein